MMTTSYDPGVLEGLADSLYRQAKSIERSYAVLGFVAGAIIGAVTTTATHGGRFQVNQDLLVSAVTVGFIVCGLAYAVAVSRALALRVQAQQILCQVAIEGHLSELVKRGAPSGAPTPATGS
jgi:hypothetical protein